MDTEERITESAKKLKGLAERLISSMEDAPKISISISDGARRVLENHPAYKAGKTRAAIRHYLFSIKQYKSAREVLEKAREELKELLADVEVFDDESFYVESGFFEVEEKSIKAHKRWKCTIKNKETGETYKNYNFGSGAGP
jgi:hypothetical protein